MKECDKRKSRISSRLLKCRL